MKIGAHFSIAGGIANALISANEADADCLQIFISNPRAWACPNIDDSEFSKFNELRKKLNITPVVVHSPYLPNIASPDNQIYQKSIKILKANIDAAMKIYADYFVVHPGNFMFVDLDKSIKRAADAVNILLSNSAKIQILIENTAGQGSEIGFLFSQLGKILNKIKNKKRCGLCIDTAHLYAAGYDFTDVEKLNDTIREASNFFDISMIKLFHFNDTLVNCGSLRDSHFYINQGNLKIETFKLIMANAIFKELSAIAETPEKLDVNHKNAIALLKSINI